MCGLFGYIGECSSDRLRRCAQTLTHRGPDAFGEYHDPDSRVYLAHCRLSIIDLSERSQQPMASANGRLQLVFNGEIYNYRELRKELESAGCRFCTTSDTEVILHAYALWGRACLDRLVGMFVFAAWDRDRRELFLARDRLGIKPLYIVRGDGFFAFASEAKALLGLPGYSRSINAHGLVTFLLYSYVIGRESIWQGMERLPPGQWLLLDVDSGREESGTFWKLPRGVERYSLEEAMERVDALLEKVVSDHLVADVPVGVLLSGGLDSGLVAAHAARSHPETDTYSMGFVDWEQNELDGARSIAEHLGLPNTPYVLEQADFLDVERTLGIFDEPIGDTAIFPTEYVCRMARRHVKVALSGDGGDELFGGYIWYLNLEGDPFWRQLTFLVESMRRAVGLGRSWPRGCANHMEYHRMLTSPSFSESEIMDLFPWLENGLCTRVQEEVGRECPKMGGGYKRWQYFDAATYLVDNNLVRVDRASMAHGLEVRVPFVDHRLAEIAFSLPDEFCVDGRQTKVLMRELARHHLPEATTTRRKQGFSFPLFRLWTLDRMIDSIRKGRLMREGIISPAGVNRLLDELRVDNRPYQIWLLAVLEFWCRRWWR
jgi:asparagine synthase (glutamine-hydrolysing)